MRGGALNAQRTVAWFDRMYELWFRPIFEFVEVPLGWPSFVEDLHKLRDSLEHDRSNNLIIKSPASTFDAESQRAALVKKKNEFSSLIDNIEKKVEAYLGIVTNPLFDDLANIEVLMKSVEDAKTETIKERKMREKAEKKLFRAQEELAVLVEKKKSKILCWKGCGLSIEIF